MDLATVCNEYIRLNFYIGQFIGGFAGIGIGVGITLLIVRLTRKGE